MSTIVMSQCTYRCVVLPDLHEAAHRVGRFGLNAPTGAWCSLTPEPPWKRSVERSQCTYRCVVLPDGSAEPPSSSAPRLNAPTGAWCSLTGGPERARSAHRGLNAPTGAWCSLTPALGSGGMTPLRGPGAPPAPGAHLRTGQHRAQSST